MKKSLLVPFMVILMIGQALADQIPSDYPIILRIIHATSSKRPNYSKHGHPLEFKKLIERQTHGMVRVEIYPLGQLYNDPEGVVAVSNGTIFAAIVDTAPLNAWDKGFGIFNLPGLFMDIGHLYRFIKSDKGGKELERRAQAKGLLVSWWVAGPVVMFTTDKPITRLEDMRRCKIRTQPTKLMVKAMESLGAGAIAIPVSEMYTAAQTGLVNGVATLEMSIALRRLDEVFHYCLENTIYFNQGSSVCSIVQLNRMPSRIRSMVIEAWHQSGKTFEKELLNNTIGWSSRELRKRGVNYTRLEPEKWKRFQNAWNSLLKEQGPEIGRSLYAEAIRTRNED